MSEKRNETDVLLAEIADLQKQLQETRAKVLDREKTFHDLFKNAQIGLLKTRISDGKVLEANDYVANIFGYDDPEAFKNEFYFSGAYAEPDARKKMIRQIKREGTVQNYQSCMRRKDRSEFWIKYSAHINREKELLHGVIEEITENKMIRDKLGHSRELLRYIIDHTNSAVAVHDRDMNYIYVSRRYLQQYDIEEENVIGKNHYEVLPNIPEKWRDIHRRALAGEVIRADRDPYVRPDGKSEWTRWECRPWYNADGSIGGIIVYTELITDRVQKEEALRESEEKYRLLIDKQNDLVVKVDPDGRFLFVSPSYCTTFGKSEAELLGKTYLPLVHEEDRAKTAEAMKKLYEPPYTVQLEQRAMTAKGWRWIEWVDTALRDKAGKVQEIIGVGRDITEQKEAGMKAEESERRLASLIGNLPGFVYRCMYDKNWTMLYLSAKFEDISGYPAQDFIKNKRFAYNDIILPEHRKSVSQKWKEAIRTRGMFEEEYLITTADNEQCWVWERGRGVFDDQNNLLFLEGYIEDISERKNAETALSFERNQLLSIFESIDDIIYISDPHTYEILYTNKSAKDMFKKDPVGNICYKEFHGLDAPCSFCTNDIILKQNPAPYHWDFHNTKINRDFSIADRMIQWPDGREVRFEIARDVTRQKKAERELIDLKDNLEVQVEEKTHELKERISRLERFHRATIDREYRIKELRTEIEKLKSEKEQGES